MHYGQVANFKTDSKIPTEKFAIAINSNLKKSIVIKSAEEVDEKFHSRLSCKRKTYRYVINNSKVGTAIYRNLETHIPMKLNIEKMKQAIQYFEGEHDFKAFKASGTSAKSSIRTIYKAEIIEKENERIWIELTGNGFLYNMVRIICRNISRSWNRRHRARRSSEYYKRKRKRKSRKNITTTRIIFSKSTV